MKTKTQILYPKKTSKQYKFESHCNSDGDEWDRLNYLYYQEWCAADDDWDYYYAYQNDPIRLRQEKIDTILGINNYPSLGDIIPVELRSKK